MAERKKSGPPTTGPRGGPRPATPSVAIFGFGDGPDKPPAQSSTQRNYPSEEPEEGAPDNTHDDDEHEDEPEIPPAPGPSNTGKEKEGPPGSTKIRNGIYEIGLNRYIDSSIPALVRDEACDLRQSYLQSRLTSEGLTKRDRKILKLDTMESFREQLAIMQALVGEETAFEAFEDTYSEIQQTRGFTVDIYRTSQRPSHANSLAHTPLSSRPGSPSYVHVGSPTILATFQPKIPTTGGGGPPIRQPKELNRIPPILLGSNSGYGTTHSNVSIYRSTQGLVLRTPQKWRNQKSMTESRRAQKPNALSTRRKTTFTSKRSSSGPTPTAWLGPCSF